MQTVEELRNEIRYSQRLCERTARLYRRLQTLSTFLTVAGGSAAVLALGLALPKTVVLVFGVLAALFVALIVAVRPADKAVANENDAKRYSALLTQANTLDAAQLRAALDKARESVVAEIEPLRDVVWNDVVVEIGQSAYQVPLTAKQKLLASLA
ncbi:hypothetical protein [Methylibium petroleiphilum]